MKSRISLRASDSASGCVGNDCKLDLVDIHGVLTAPQYSDHILRTHVEPHIDNHALTDGAVSMQDGLHLLQPE